MRQIDKDAEPLAFAHDVAAKLGEAFARPNRLGAKIPPCPAALRRACVKPTERRPSS